MTMYNSKLVASLKANGKVLREFKDTIYVPFGSEYSILLKNLNTVRAIVNITIDGEEMVPGGLVLNAHQEIDLQRSIKNGNLTEGNRFKFIERTGNIEKHRGVKLEDGLVRIEYQFERPMIRIDDMWWKNGDRRDFWGPTYGHYNVGGSSGIGGSSGDYHTKGALRGVSINQVTNDSVTYSDTTLNVSAQAASYNDVGITVPGSKSEQKFATVNNFPVESEKYVIVLKLLGETPDNKPVIKPVTVATKPECVTCGKHNKATAKFCTECGTALTVFA